MYQVLTVRKWYNIVLCICVPVIYALTTGKVTTSSMSLLIEQCDNCLGNFKFLRRLGKRELSLMVLRFSVILVAMNKRHSSWIVFTNSLAAIPVFPRPTTPDRPINPTNSPLQFNGTGRYWTGCYFWNLILILKRGCPPLGRGRSPSQGLPPHWYMYVL